MKHLMKLKLLAGMVCLLSIFAGAARAVERDTPERDGRYVAAEAGAAISAGQMVGILPADGEAYPAGDTATLAVVGRAENSAAEGETVIVKRGTFRWTNGGAFTAGDIGQMAYAFGVGTVATAAIATNDAPAGVIQDVDDAGVWVDTYNRPVELTSSVTALTITGNAAVGGTLAVTGASTLTGATTVTGALTARVPVKTASTLTATSKTCTAADYGTVVCVSTNAAVSITLPANGAAAGSYIDVMVAGSDACAPTIAAAQADTLVGPNDVDLDSVTWGTGHRIGAYARFMSDGAVWHVQNLAGTTMTYTD